MKVKWFGQSAFLLSSKDGVRVIMDPYAVTDTIKYDLINEPADVVTVSHDHRDHNNVGSVTGNPQVLRNAGTFKVKDLEIKGLVSAHDNACGSQRGSNIIFCFTMDGIRACHLGDLGHQPSEQLLAQIGKVDLLLLPTGGTYCLEPAAASELCDKIKPAVAMPMHYKTAKRVGQSAEIGDFVKLRQNVKTPDASEVELDKDRLPTPTQVIVLKHAR